MKKFTLVLMVVSIVFASSSCKKDSTDPTYTKSQFIGKWKQTSPAEVTGVSYITFNDTQLITSRAINGVETADAGINYTFDGKVITCTTILGNVTYTIKSASATTLVLTEDWVGIMSLGDFTYTKQ